MKLFAIALLGGALSLSLQATPISGTFTLNGTVIVTTSGLIEWLSNTSVPSQATISSGGLSGSFAGLAGQTVEINTLTNLPGDQPVNTPFPNFNFIDFTADPTFPELLANFIPLGTGSAINCSTNPALAAINQTCTLTATTTPPQPGGSPFTFANGANGVGGCCSSTATWNISGVTSDLQSSWTAVFNATFNGQSYQQTLANFVTTGSASRAYSADVTVTLTPVPEPTTLAYMGAGVVLLALGGWRRKRNGARS